MVEKIPTTRVTEFDIDNRDVNCTWLHLKDGTIVEVDPVELFRNALENADVLDDFWIKALNEI